MRGFPRSLPLRGLQRVRRPTTHGVSSLKAAYERVARAVGLSPMEVGACYRARKRKLMPGAFTNKHYVAMTMLDETEAQLEERIRKLVGDANALHKDIDGRKRFAYYHTRYSVRSVEGWPDDVLLDRKECILYIWENKRETESPGPEQTNWLNDLGMIAALTENVVMLGVIRPSNYDSLYDVLDISKYMGRDGPHTDLPAP